MKKSLKMFLIVIALVICIGGYITIVYTYKTNKDKQIAKKNEENITKQDIDKFLFFLKYDLDNSPKTRNRKLATLKQLKPKIETKLEIMLSFVCF